MVGQGVVIRDDFIGKAQVYLFLAARSEHAIPRQSQMLSLGLFLLLIFKFFDFDWFLWFLNFDLFHILCLYLV